MIAFVLNLLWHLVGFFVWVPMAVAFWIMRTAQRRYHDLWKGALKITEEVQAENERLVSERDEAIGLSQQFQRLASRTEGVIEENSDLNARLNELVEIGRREREKTIDEQRARLMAKRNYHRMPSNREARDILRTLRRMGAINR